MNSDWQSFLKNNRAQNSQPCASDKIDSTDNIMTALSHLSLIKISGDDAENFLHNQFSSNIKKLIPNSLHFSAWCNPKGQVINTFFISKQKNYFLILLPNEEKERFINKLKIFIFRSKVELQDNNEWVSIGLSIDDTSLLSNITNDLIYLSVDNIKNKRYILIGSVDQQKIIWEKLQDILTPIGAYIWEFMDIMAAYPWITHMTSEKFLPQMLNLDKIDGLDYEKGCYPGQEIIARLHFKGQLKRSLYLAKSDTGTPSASGDNLYHNDEKVGTIINIQNYQSENYMLIVLDKAQEANKIALQSNAILEFLPLPYLKGL